MPKAKLSLVKTAFIEYKPNAAPPPDLPLRATGFGGQVYAQISDNSLLKAGIYKGDWLSINTFEAVGNGQIIVIQEKGQMILGIARFIGGGKLKLEYSNDSFPPLVYELSKIRIVGRVVGLEGDLR